MVAGAGAGPEERSSMARRRLSASYFSGELSDRPTEGLELVFGVMGVVGEYSGMERGDPIPESTECGCSEPPEPGPEPVLPERRRAPRCAAAADPAPTMTLLPPGGGAGKLVTVSEAGPVEGSGLGEQPSSLGSDLSKLSCNKKILVCRIKNIYSFSSINSNKPRGPQNQELRTALLLILINY